MAARLISGVRLEVVVADITTLRVDAIVNAANTSLLGEALQTAPAVRKVIFCCFSKDSAVLHDAALDAFGDTCHDQAGRYSWPFVSSRQNRS